MRWSRNGNLWMANQNGWSLGILSVDGDFHIRMVKDEWVIQTTKSDLPEAKRAVTRMLNKLVRTP